MNRALIIEDSRTQAEQLRLILESEGFEVDVAFDGEEGLRLAGTSSFDLIVSDILMPGISGYDVCRTLKADPMKRDIPVILLTTLSDAMDIIRGLECGADNFITKPYEPGMLVERIRNVLETKRLRADGKLKVGVEVMFLGTKFMITSEKHQILDLLISTFEDIVRTNRQLREREAQLASANAKIERYASQMETKALESEERYRTLMETANDAIWVTDEDGTIIEVNHQMELMLRRAAAEICGRRIYDFVVPAQIDLVTQLRERLRVEGSMRSDALVLQRSDARKVHVDVSISSVELGGQALRFAIFRDITQQRELEEKLRQSQKMEAIGRLAGGVAHDFNNLLTAILGYTQVVADQLGPDDSMREDLEQIRKAGERAASLTRQLLAFSRKQVLVPEPLDLNKVVSEIDKMLRRVIGEDIELRLALDPKLGQVMIDPTQVEQVIMNLCVNSRDAMPTGGKLTIETHNAELDETLAVEHGEILPGSYVMLAVTDTGIGMNADTMSHLFEPFFTTKPGGRGTGLGLSTVYGIVKQSGGHISIHSEPGKGTTFEIYLPRLQQVAGMSRPTRVNGSIDLSGTETILVVEDDDVIRGMVRMLLVSHGHRVFEASTPQVALTLAAQHQGPIDLLITDVVLPGMGGQELASRLSKVHQQLKVLYMSGYPDDAILRHGMLEAGSAFLQKPFTRDGFLRKVSSVLSGESA
ncbi:MAG: response regulator [Acidobacteriota bacterium]